VTPVDGLDSGWTVDLWKVEVEWPGLKKFFSLFRYFYVERPKIEQYRLPLLTAARLAAGIYRKRRS